MGVIIKLREINGSSIQLLVFSFSVVVGVLFGEDVAVPESFVLVLFIWENQL